MKTVVLKVVSCIAVAGQVVRPGELIEVTESEAKNLLHRGRCVVATEADGAPATSSDGAVAGGDGPLNPEIEAANEAAKRLAEEAAQAEADAAAAAAVIAGASEANPVEAQVVVGEQLVDVTIVGQAEDGSPVVDDASAEALETAAQAAAPAPAPNGKGKNKHK